MDIVIYLMRSRDLEYRVVVTKTTDDFDVVHKALDSYEGDSDDWNMVGYIIMKTDLYERLPQYMPIEADAVI